jgi:hypothetical protein
MEGLNVEATSLFAYGTLRDPEVRRLVLGHEIAPESVFAATAPDCQVVFFPGRTYPALRGKAGATADGTLLTRLTSVDIELLDRFEGPEYLRQPVNLIVSGTSAVADVYWPAIDLPTAAEPWRLETWQERYKAAFLAGEAASLDHLRAHLSGLPR